MSQDELQKEILEFEELETQATQSRTFVYSG